MPSAIETATERARTVPDAVPEELGLLADEAPPHAGAGQRPAGRVAESDPGDSPFEDGVSDAWESGWPMRR